ncbi:MAG: hypothetical protein JWO79_942 [Actinomycetia bacterium]|nr:hypothetical protein [Actinomycetes bacterium]
MGTLARFAAAAVVLFVCCGAPLALGRGDGKPLQARLFGTSGTFTVASCEWSRDEDPVYRCTGTFAGGGHDEAATMDVHRGAPKAGDRIQADFTSGEAFDARRPIGPMLAAVGWTGAGIGIVLAVGLAIRLLAAKLDWDFFRWRVQRAQENQPQDD